MTLTITDLPSKQVELSTMHNIQIIQFFNQAKVSVVFCVFFLNFWCKPGNTVVVTCYVVNGVVTLLMKF